jgi:hypothetical protein
MALSQISIGLTAGTLVNLYNLTAPVRPPLVHYNPGTEIGENMNGLVEDLGSPQADLVWDYIPRIERDSLRIFCTGKSAIVYVYIPTTDNQDEYKTFRAIMVWPEEDRELILYRRDFSIHLKNMIEVI